MRCDRCQQEVKNQSMNLITLTRAREGGEPDHYLFKVCDVCAKMLFRWIGENVTIMR